MIRLRPHIKNEFIRDDELYYYYLNPSNKRYERSTPIKKADPIKKAKRKARQKAQRRNRKQ